MRDNGVDWDGRLTEKSEDSRAPALDPEECQAAAFSAPSTPLNTAESRMATLQARREFLREDDEAMRRLDGMLRDLHSRGRQIEEVHRFHQWLHEGVSPPSSPPPSPEGDIEDLSAPSPGRPPSELMPETSTPTMPPWMREPLLLTDYPLSHLTTAIKEQEARKPPLATDEACRVIRASDDFGILLIGLRVSAPPSDAEVHRAFVEAKTRIESAQARAEKGVTVRHPRWQIARARVDGAWISLRDRDTRLEAWTVWLGNRKGPVTETIDCVIHATALRALLHSPAAAAPGRKPRTTVGDEVAELLSASSDHPTNPHLRVLPISISTPREVLGWSLRALSVTAESTASEPTRSSAPGLYGTRRWAR